MNSQQFSDKIEEFIIHTGPILDSCAERAKDLIDNETTNASATNALRLIFEGYSLLEDLRQSSKIVQVTDKHPKSSELALGFAECGGTEAIKLAAENYFPFMDKLLEHIITVINGCLDGIPPVQPLDEDTREELQHRAHTVQTNGNALHQFAVENAAIYGLSKSAEQTSNLVMAEWLGIDAAGITKRAELSFFDADPFQTSSPKQLALIWLLTEYSLPGKQACDNYLPLAVPIAEIVLGEAERYHKKAVASDESIAELEHSSH